MHLVHGDSAGITVAKAGAPQDSIRVTKDLLTVGPCDVDPVRHRALRSAYWDVRPWAAEAELPSTTPILVWAAPAWSDQLFLWWMFDALERAGIDATRLRWAQPRSARDLHVSVGGMTEAEMSEAFERAASVSPEQLAEGASLWRKYAADSPLPFDEARRAGSAHFPDLARSAEPHGGWFPRGGDGGLRLSEYDELILSTVGDEWRTPAELLRRERGPEITARLFFCFGDLFFLRRLRDWADHGVLRSEPRPGAGAFDSVAYRIARRPAGGKAPSLYVGGCLINDPTTPWVRVAEGDGWRIAAGPRG